MTPEDSNMKPSSSQFFQSSISESTPRFHRENRMCCNTVHPKCAAYFICIAALHEITFGTVIVLANGIEQNWWQSAQCLVILTCRLLQYPSCIIALFGIRNDNPALIVPFMLSQVSLGSYADLHTYIQLVSRCATSSNLFIDSITSPIILIVLPIVIYAVLLMLFIYNMYNIVRSITIYRSVTLTADASFSSRPEVCVMGPDDLFL